ncbi:hypothetical protein V6N11_053965 [Hibiscus sabdariffa]|uniref:Uncharacterized protein n=1 Tax=Hibiscus sabdariffa TaxID=183260 RepID=A0ABR2S2F4_9ROSI
MAAPSPTTVSLKLLIAPKSQRVLYAEAGKDFVDFLFNIMTLPVGTVVRLLSKQVTAGCIRSIYESIENLGSSYMLSEENTDILLNAQGFNRAAYEPHLLPSIQPPAYTNLYRCSYGGHGNCKVGEGFVKEAVTYMITDDLVVRPIATSSIVTLFNKYKIKDVGDLEEKVIAVGVNEQSKTALTDVFLKKKPGESDIGNSGGIHSTVL